MKKIIFIEPKAPGFHIYSKWSLPRLGTVMLATILRDLGHDVKVYVEEIQRIDKNELFSADLVGISIVRVMGAIMVGIIMSGRTGAAFAAGHLYMVVRGLIELRKHMSGGLWEQFRLGELKERDSEFWKFIGVVYWQTGIDLLPKHVSVLLAGALLGPASAGLFRLAREFSTVLTQPAVALREVLFPDLTRSFHAEDGGIHSVSFKTAIIAGIAGLAFVVFSFIFGESLLGIVGEEYVPAAALLSLLLLAASFDLASAPLRAAAYAMGRAGTVLNIHIGGIVTYLSMFFLLTPLMGLAGPGLAAVLASLLALGLTARLIARMSAQAPG